MGRRDAKESKDVQTRISKSSTSSEASAYSRLPELGPLPLPLQRRIQPILRLVFDVKDSERLEMKMSRDDELLVAPVGDEYLPTNRSSFS